MAKKKQTKKVAGKKKAARKLRPVIVGNERYGLYYGLVDATDDEINKKKAVRMTACRHVCRWYCAEAGGITSLARIGPDPTKGNRIGGPADAFLTGVVNVYDCTPEAAKAFDGIEPSA